MAKICLLLLIFMAIVTTGCVRKHEHLGEPSKSIADSLLTDEPVSFTYKVFKNDSSAGFGYDIYENGIPKIHQPMIPAVQGMHGFETEEQASKTAELVIYKIKHNISPPFI